MDGVVDVVFSGRAVQRGAAPAWSGGICSGVACHGAGLRADPEPAPPVWLDTTGAAGKCGACHGVPPVVHAQTTACETCHGDEIAHDASGAPVISQSGTALHVNGVFDHLPP
jgi:predicted CxxxxCH...CXXCH cytochrome family protein